MNSTRTTSTPPAGLGDPLHRPAAHSTWDMGNEIVTHLLVRQNTDGGWGFGGESSATEPTALAVLALAGDIAYSSAVARGRAWLLKQQRPDGGWPPRPAVQTSTYVTALALLALDGAADLRVLRGGTEWLLRQRNRESSVAHRLRLFLLGKRPEMILEQAWSWYPQTAGWVTPTALAVLALRRWAGAQLKPVVEVRVGKGQEYLWGRQCRDGGWNHGASRALGYEADSYPETTGQALLALHGTTSPRLARALAAAERHLESCRSAEGIAWLQMGLLAHGRRPNEKAIRQCRARTTVDMALCLLASRAAKGDHAFVGGTRAL